MALREWYMLEGNTWVSEQKHVVIIGGGFAGLRAARGLGGQGCRVTLIDRENHHLFQPLLYQVATAGLSPNQVSTPIRAVLRSYSNISVLFAEVITVDKEAKHVCLDGGEAISYDYLVVAAGAKTNYFGNDTWAQHAHGLKDLRDAIRLRERVLLAFESAERESDPDQRRRLLTFAIIGGGPTGVEMAGAIAELGRQVLAADYHTIQANDIRVILLERNTRVLKAFHEDLSEDATRQLEELGVEVRCGSSVTEVTERGVELEGEDIPAAVVVWATGVQAVSLSERLHLPLASGGRIVVGQDCSVQGYPEIFAVGDIAYFVPEGEEWPLPGLAPVAMQQGSFVARAIRSDLLGRARPRFSYKDKGIMATIGRSRAVVEAGPLRLRGWFAWAAWLVIHIWYLIGFRNRLLVLFEWGWAYMTFRRGARIITARLFPIRGQADRGELRPGPSPLHVQGTVGRRAARQAAKEQSTPDFKPDPTSWRSRP
jgi:NADH dehydrogenase